VQILPCCRASAGQILAGLELAPFRGVRYAQGRVSGLAEVTSPPYDVIFRDKEDQLMAADPYNVVRLILPLPRPGRPGEEYRDAAISLEQWLAEQILVVDPEPALYVYEQGPDGAAGGDSVADLQRGLIGAIRLVPLEAGIVLPHEDVSPGPVAGRLALMEATEANLEPIFLLYDGRDAPGAAARIVAETAVSEPLIEARTADGTRHRLWAITDRDRLAAIAADLAPRQALIADGHHRYAAYLRLQARRHQAGDGQGPWDYGLAMLVDSASYPPRIGSIHRVIPGLGVSDAVKLAAAAFTVRPLPRATGDVGAAMAALADASDVGPAYVLVGATAAYLVTDPDPAKVQAAMPAGASAPWQALPAAILQQLLIMKLWHRTDDDATVQVVHHDADAAVRAAVAAAGTAVLCNPMSPAEVYAVAARGEKVPRKSTSFAPKPRTGLVLRTFAKS
jgi:uncharacterized protein (DUF1015 family)